MTGGEDFIVRLFDLTRAENPFNCIVTRFTAPVRAVAFSHTGSAVAAGGE